MAYLMSWRSVSDSHMQSGEKPITCHGRASRSRSGKVSGLSGINHCPVSYLASFYLYYAVRGFTAGIWVFSPPPPQPALYALSALVIRHIKAPRQVSTFATAVSSECHAGCRSNTETFLFPSRISRWSTQERSCQMNIGGPLRSNQALSWTPVDDRSSRNRQHQ